MNRLFQPPPKPEFQGFKNKVFHLSGNFKKPDGKMLYKKYFAIPIENLGGICRGFKKDNDSKKSGRNKSITDYLVIGKDDYGKWENQRNIEEHNNKNPMDAILILSQDECEELISEYQSKPKP